MGYRRCIHLIGKDMVRESISKLRLARLQDHKVLCQMEKSLGKGEGGFITDLVNMIIVKGVITAEW